MNMASEALVDLGDGLFGVLGRPAEGNTRTPLVVLLNAGFVHRVGPFRFHVHLARSLAAEGFAVLRFDLPGLGDAPAKTSADESAVVSRVLDHVGAIAGVESFVVGGLCSAADLGWKVALADVRVRGLLLLDPLARRGPWFRLGQLRLIVGRGPVHWWAMLRRRLRPRVSARTEDYRDWPQAGAERDQLQQLVDRGVSVLALYTGGSAPWFLGARQFAATFGAAARHPRVEFAYWPDCDHTFMSCADQGRLAALSASWVARIRAV